LEGICGQILNDFANGEFEGATEKFGLKSAVDDRIEEYLKSCHFDGICRDEIAGIILFTAVYSRLVSSGALMQDDRVDLKPLLDPNLKTVDALKAFMSATRSVGISNDDLSQAVLLRLVNCVKKNLKRGTQLDVIIEHLVVNHFRTYLCVNGLDENQKVVFVDAFAKLLRAIFEPL
jgi:hypothetical protein